MDQRVSPRRFVVPALLAGLTLCGTLVWSSSASARDLAGRVTVNATHVAPVARAAHPTLSSVPLRSTASRTVPATSTATKTVALHLTPGAMPAPIGQLAMLKM